VIIDCPVGIKITATNTDIKIRSNNRFVGTVPITISDAGTNTHIESNIDVTRTGIAQGAGTGNNQIQLDAEASAVDGAYDPSLVSIIRGTGIGQSRLILQYDGTTKTATVDRNWKTNPDTTSEFVIRSDAGREHVNEGLLQGATSTTATLNALASSVDDMYKQQVIFIRSGTGDDQAKIITAYNGTTKVATIDGTWQVTPDSTSAYTMLPTHIYADEQLATSVTSNVWDELTSAHTTSGTFGDQVGSKLLTIAKFLGLK